MGLEGSLRAATAIALDAAVYDRQYFPFISHQHSAIFVPAESAFAVAKVKQGPDRSMLEYAGANARSVRRLKRTSARFAWAQGMMKRGEPFPIPAGIVSSSTTNGYAPGKPR